MDKPKEFKAKIVDGKLSIQPITEITKHPGGRQDVNIHLPSVTAMREVDINKFTSQELEKLCENNE